MPKRSASLYPEELYVLMWLYGQSGIAEWEKAPADLLPRATRCLHAKIAENEREVEQTLNVAFNEQNASSMSFIPMPAHSKNPKLEQSFFVPLCKIDGQGQRIISFELFVLVRNEDCLAYRFEPAHQSPSRHNYSHVQMCRQVLGGRIGTEAPDWIPDSYPAHPLYSSEPLSMFLSMMTAVHGYDGGILTVLNELFTQAGRPRDAQTYLDKLREMLISRDVDH
jgi:hypothetical protein